MSAFKRNILLFSIAVTLFAFTVIPKKSSVVIQGTVTSNNNPVSRAHVYVVDGEEEALTNSKGEFKIITWQNAPFTITVEHSDFETKKLRVTDAAQRQQVVLKKK